MPREGARSMTLLGPKMTDKLADDETPPADAVAVAPEPGAPELSTFEATDVSIGATAETRAAPVPASAIGEIRVQGKFFFAGETKHFVKGVTYGPFAVGTHGAQFPEWDVVAKDFSMMAA